MRSQHATVDPLPWFPCDWASSTWAVTPFIYWWSTRAVAGSLKVHMFLVAGQVEKAIVSGLKEHLDEEAVLVAELLA